MESLNLENDLTWPALSSNSKHAKCTTPKLKSNVHISGKVECSQLKIQPNCHHIPPNQPQHLIDAQNVSLRNISQSREEIIENRKKRRKERKEEARLIKYEEKRLKNIELSKSRNVSIIDKSTMNSMLSHNSDNSFIGSSINVTNESNYRSIISTKHIKINDPLTVDISSIIKTKNTKPKSNPVFFGEPERILGNKLDSDKPHMQRGKKYENNKKSVTKFKKLIMQSRSEKSYITGHVHAPEQCSLEKPEQCDTTNQLNLKFQQMCLAENSAEIPQNIVQNNSISPQINVCLDNSSTADLKATLKCLISILFTFQDRAYKKNPIKANMRKRYVVGFREVLKSVKLNNACMIVIATDTEKINCEGGISDIVNQIEQIGSESAVPIIHALKRREIGYITHKKVGVSCLAVLNKEGAEEIYNKCLEYHTKTTTI